MKGVCGGTIYIRSEYNNGEMHEDGMRTDHGEEGRIYGAGDAKRRGIMSGNGMKELKKQQMYCNVM